MAVEFVSRNPMMVVPILGGTVTTRYNVELIAGGPGGQPSAEQVVVPADPVGIQYVYRTLLVADNDDCWSQFHVHPSAGATGPGATPWLRHLGGVPFNFLIPPPGWLVQLPPGAELHIHLSAGGMGVEKRLAGIATAWKQYGLDLYQGAPGTR